MRKNMRSIQILTTLLCSCLPELPEGYWDQCGTSVETDTGLLRIPDDGQCAEGLVCIPPDSTSLRTGDVLHCTVPCDDIDDCDYRSSSRDCIETESGGWCIFDHEK